MAGAYRSRGGNFSIAQPNRGVSASFLRLLIMAVLYEGCWKQAGQLNCPCASGCLKLLGASGGFLLFDGFFSFLIPIALEKFGLHVCFGQVAQALAVRGVSWRKRSLGVWC